jgi:hypothetical protein
VIDLSDVELPTPCVVSWIDAYASEHQDPRSVESEADLLMHSCGWLIGANEWGLALAVDRYPALFDGGEYRDFSFIPFPMIRELHICSGGLDING